MVQHGYIRTVTFDDAVINATIRSLGGWERLCETPAEKFDVFTRRDFESAYTRLARSGVGEEHGAPLVGWIDRTNYVNGHGAGEPLLIATGLPPLPNSPRIGQGSRADVPRLELQKP